MQLSGVPPPKEGYFSVIQAVANAKLTDSKN